MQYSKEAGHMDDITSLLIYLAVAVSVGALLSMARYLRRIAEALEERPRETGARDPARLPDDSNADFTSRREEKTGSRI
jgi:hypothetical protein